MCDCMTLLHLTGNSVDCETEGRVEDAAIPCHLRGQNMPIYPQMTQMKIQVKISSAPWLDHIKMSSF